MSKHSVTVDDRIFEVDVRVDPSDPTRYTVMVDGDTIPVLAPFGNEENLSEWVLIGNRPYEIVLDPDLHWVKTWSGRHRLSLRNLDATSVAPQAGGDGRVKAPIPGLIVQVLVEPGQSVHVGQAVMILEAMKMENQVRARRSGQVLEIRVEPGQAVGMGDVLMEIG